MKKMIEDKQKLATSEPTGGHERGGNPNPFRGREISEVEVLEGDDGMPPLEPLSREVMSMGYNRRGADFVGRSEEYHSRGTEFEGRREEIQRRCADFEGRREEFYRRRADLKGEEENMMKGFAEILLLALPIGLRLLAIANSSISYQISTKSACDKYSNFGLPNSKSNI
ncbi:hypothetical protein M5K25_023549 [Dendrobium thyrsiflorum]|uniref:Uncharacterized protein n=1 Tax=Dendrobium thyrsiflorum TaxID=117978 RepID=A0ABD0UFD1_DENTH